MKRTEPQVTPPARLPGQPWPLDLAAEFLSVSRRHLERLVAEGKIKVLSLGHRKLIADAEMKRLAETGC